MDRSPAASKHDITEGDIGFHSSASSNGDARLLVALPSSHTAASRQSPVFSALSSDQMPASDLITHMHGPERTRKTHDEALHFTSGERHDLTLQQMPEVKLLHDVLTAATLITLGHNFLNLRRPPPDTGCVMRAAEKCARSVLPCAVTA